MLCNYSLILKMVSKKINQDLVDFLEDCGVCQICQLRYLKARGSEYQSIKETFEKLNIKYGRLDVNCSEESATKKPRKDVCPTCLGLFSKEFQQCIIDGILKTDIEKYDYRDVVVAISMPMMLQIRQLSMWYGLLERFSPLIDMEKAPDVPLKEAAKLILNPIICKELHRNYEANGVQINVTLVHNKEMDELAKLQKLHERAFPRPPNTKRQDISRGLIEKQYIPKRLKGELFKQFFPVPPAVVAEPLNLKSIELLGPTIFVAGRYCKLTRELSHTPWILNGHRVMKDSIEEIIIRNVTPLLCNDQSKVIFMSSGREDVDVRCLGKGRPFVLEISNAFTTKLSTAEAYRIECDIDKSRKISVRHLQIVKREELVHIKSGEEKKRKFYRALCMLQEPATLDVLEKLNLPQGFEIKQKTPIRVLHRRPLHTRPRMVYSLKAWVHKENCKILVLDIVSQAGTYIKELVHGEFGRTVPSIAALIGRPIDIVALDVMAIDLDWPNPIKNSNSEE
uniref:tRNA pseudouridine(55) synthase n=1 Tax=Glossina austeni TaxID=7395 RepID=A0A1A9UPZ7_GLOAU